MAFNFRKFLIGLNIVPKTSSTVDSQGDLDVTSADGKLHYHNGVSSSPVVTEAHAATLTNKTLDASQNTFIGVTTDSGTATLTNKTIDADQNTILNIDDNEIRAGANISRSKLASGTANHVLINSGVGAMSSEATLAKSRGGSGQDNSSITFPASGVLVTQDGVQTLSNKTFSDAPILSEIATPATPASGFGKIYFKNDGFLYQLNDDGTETRVGSGSSSSGNINYITNSDFESNALNWSAYADAAAAVPVDGTGGAPVVTITRTVSSPLRGVGSGLITKDAANRQGQGVSADFTINSADLAKPLFISFDYTPSVNFIAGDSSDIRVYLYDVTNAQIIQPAPYTIQGGSGSNQRFLGTFQTNSNSTSYRFILHIATTNALAWTFKFDNVQVGPQSLNYGAPASTWQQFTPVVNNLSGFSSGPQGFWRRSGDSMEVQIGFTKNGSAGVSGSNLSVQIPAGYSIDSMRYLGTNSSTAGWASTFMFVGASGYKELINVFPSGPLTLALYKPGASVPIIGTEVAANAQLALYAIVPIVGWESNVLMSNDTDTRVVAARVYLSSDQLTSSAVFETAQYDVIDFDTHGAWNTGLFRYVVPVSGFYRITHKAQWFVNGTGNRIIGVQKNGGSIYELESEPNPGSVDMAGVNGSIVLKLVAGDFLNALVYQSSGIVLKILSGQFAGSYINIERLTGPSAIAASEAVGLNSTSGNAQVLVTSGADVTATQSAILDTHGSLSSNVWTSPVSGIFYIEASNSWTSNATGKRETRIQLSTNSGGSWTDKSIQDQPGSAAAQTSTKASVLIRLFAGYQIRVVLNQTSGGSLSTVSDGSQNMLNIMKIGI